MGWMDGMGIWNLEIWKSWGMGWGIRVTKRTLVRRPPPSKNGVPANPSFPYTWGGGGAQRRGTKRKPYCGSGRRLSAITY